MHCYTFHTTGLIRDRIATLTLRERAPLVTQYWKGAQVTLILEILGGHVSPQPNPPPPCSTVPANKACCCVYN